MPEIIAKSRYVQSAPRKLRAVAKLVSGKQAEHSLIILLHTQKKAAGILARTIKSAMANATNNFNFEKENLVIKHIRIDAGPTLKRFIAMSRGSGNRYQKRTSHITVILFTTDSPVPKTKTTAKVTKSTKKTATDKQDKKTKPDAPSADPKTPVKKSPAKKKTDTKSDQPKGTKTTVSVRSRKKK